MLCTEILALYLRHSATNGVHGPAARRERERTAKLFSWAYPALTVEDARPFHLTDFIAAHPEWRSSATRRQKANGIKAAFAWAVREERTARNPFATVRFAEAERRPDLPDRLLDQLAVIASKAFERVLRFLRMTGCRVGELERAMWADIDLERGAWTIPQHKSRRKTGRVKVVGLPDAAIALLRSMAPACTGLPDALVVGAVAAASAHVFVNSRGKPWAPGTLTRQFIRYRKQLDLPSGLTLHGIRHRFGSAAVAAGAPIKLISAQLGHSSVKTTERYYVDLSDQIGAIRAAAALASS